MKSVGEEIVDALYGKQTSLRLERHQLIHLIEEAIKLNEALQVASCKAPKDTD